MFVGGAVHAELCRVCVGTYIHMFKCNCLGKCLKSGNVLYILTRFSLFCFPLFFPGHDYVKTSSTWQPEWNFLASI